MAETKTTKELRADLCAALRSGLFEQGKGYLSFRNRENGPTKMCCLGVACTLVQAPTKKSFQLCETLYVDIWGEFKSESLPQDIMEAYGFRTAHGQFTVTSELEKKFPQLQKNAFIGSEGKRQAALTELNDSFDWTFKQIADLIEAEPEGLFVD
jgi:hypothetical protein